MELVRTGKNVVLAFLLSVSILSCGSGGGSSSSTSGGLSTSSSSSGSVVDAPKQYTVGGMVSGLIENTEIELFEEESNSILVISGNGAFTFNTLFSVSDQYSVSVASQSTGQFCTISNNSGSLNDANISGVSVSCSPNIYSVSGSVDGLVDGDVIELKYNDEDSIALENGDFTLQLPYGVNYNLEVVSQPKNFECALLDGALGVIQSDVAGVSISCSAVFALAVNVTGLELELNDTLNVTLPGVGVDEVLEITSNEQVQFESMIRSQDGLPELHFHAAYHDCVVDNFFLAGIENVSVINVVCQRLDQYQLQINVLGLAAGYIDFNENITGQQRRIVAESGSDPSDLRSITFDKMPVDRAYELTIEQGNLVEQNCELVTDSEDYVGEVQGTVNQNMRFLFICDHSITFNVNENTPTGILASIRGSEAIGLEEFNASLDHGELVDISLSNLPEGISCELFLDRDLNQKFETNILIDRALILTPSCDIAEYPVSVNSSGTKRAFSIGLSVEDVEPLVRVIDAPTELKFISELYSASYDTTYTLEILKQPPGALCNIIENDLSVLSIQKNIGEENEIVIYCRPSDLIEDVEIIDPTLRDCIRKISAEKNWKQVFEVSTISCEGSGDATITGLDGIEVFRNVKTVNLDNNLISTVEPLLSLLQLERISMISNPIDDFEKLNQLPKLISSRRYSGEGDVAGADFISSYGIDLNLGEKYLFYDNAYSPEFRFNYKFTGLNTCTFSYRLRYGDGNRSSWREFNCNESSNDSAYRRLYFELSEPVEDGAEYELEFEFNILNTVTDRNRIESKFYDVIAVAVDNIHYTVESAVFGMDDLDLRRCIADQIRESEISDFGALPLDIVSIDRVESLDLGCGFERGTEINLQGLDAFSYLSSISVGENIPYNTDTLYQLPLLREALPVFTDHLVLLNDISLVKYVVDTNLRSCILRNAAQAGAEYNDDLEVLRCPTELINSFSGLEYFTKLSEIEFSDPIADTYFRSIDSLEGLNQELLNCIQSTSEANGWDRLYEVSFIDCSQTQVSELSLLGLDQFANLQSIIISPTLIAPLTSDFEIVRKSPDLSHSISFAGEDPDWNFQVSGSVKETLINSLSNQSVIVEVSRAFSGGNSYSQCELAIDLFVRGSEGSLSGGKNIASRQSCGFIGSRTDEYDLNLPATGFSGEYMLRLGFSVSDSASTNEVIVTREIDLTVNEIELAYSTVGNVFNEIGFVPLRSCIESQYPLGTSLEDVTSLNLADCGYTPTTFVDLTGIQHFKALENILFSPFKAQGIELLDQLPFLDRDNLNDYSLVVELNQADLESIMPDEGLRHCVLGAAENNPFLEDTINIVELDCSEYYVTSLKGIEYLRSLLWLDLSEQPITQEQKQYIDRLPTLNYLDLRETLVDEPVLIDLTN